MKQYAVDVDITMSNRIYVDAENEEAAKAIVNNKILADPYYYAKESDAYVKHEVTDVYEAGDSEHTELDDAMDYVRKEMDDDELIIYKATVSKNMNCRCPVGAGLDDGKIIDLLEEYGEDNGLSEGWWEEYGDIEDILMKL